MSTATHPQPQGLTRARRPLGLGLHLAMLVRRDGRARVPIATKLVLSYVLIIAVALAVAGIVGTQVVDRLIVSEAQTAVRTDLNAAREIFMGRLDDINDVVRLTADRSFIKEALLAGRLDQAADELEGVRRNERLDFLTVVDPSGRVLLRTTRPGLAGDDRSQDELIAAARKARLPVAGIAIMTADDLRRESPALADRAHLELISTPRARPRGETELRTGMVLKAAAPIVSPGHGLIGLLYGGVLLNQDFEAVDKIKRTVFQDVRYKGKDIGTATIFLDDVRISTNVMNADGSRAIGTRIAEDVYRQVALQGKPWIDRAFVVNDWYITAYEPIRTVSGTIIGILYVGVLEEKYVDMRMRTIAAFLTLTLAGGLVSLALSYRISRKVSRTISHLAAASREMAHGDLNVRVEIKTRDELEDLADAFNAMASSLKRRDELLKEYARSKIMESERLAITGQLAAGVAHELNNPLQGIVTYSHLLLERVPVDSPVRASLQKIANQADRCREIIRGLLDFSRPRAPQLKLSSVNAVLRECVSLLEKQALFHNIKICAEFQPDLPPSVIDPSQMQEVFVNIIINAAEAMDGVGRLVLATRLDGSQNFIEVEFTDTGHGIRPEDLGHIFDPFFTTKDPGHGTGLGLAISKGIVEKHKGTIAVTSQTGKGTTFVIRLPVTTQVDA
jgi:two-component system NtrC family sensor kinase